MTSSWIVWLACIALAVRVVRCWEHTDANALESTLGAHEIALVACKWTTFNVKV